MLDAALATWPEVKDFVREGRIGLLPVGAQEQHGPHLPLATDTVMATGFARRLAEALDALLLPALPYGDAWNNEGFPGTLSLSPETVQRTVEDLARGVRRIGLGALIVVNGHFGNREPIALAARELWRESGFPVLCLDYPGLESLADEICASAPAAPTFYHADEVETSVMLALAPEAVRMERAISEYPVFPPTFGAEPMQLSSFCQSGVFGNSRPATAEKGERLLEGLTAASVDVIRTFLARHGLVRAKNSEEKPS
ncbi:creatinine amidohydrolase [Faunimonas pinastri]|uniref:Creatinine amidohydrolase n=1 Tax=Faunimonas pinastri TaxID=1855383 RepID=A0A1H9Q4F9_9HYPH|nr:creatininase family protein [Faunimonas pinastri]SER55466.1 creatinine amidohydrolase [Faunimonas pinastri]